ncbi:hypothetical protein LTR37_018977 [Vermiconidia calcicola]|uniref:Uncharacterized protein n=1 Tax=Vermiconidia calcicola TaxID=1690605 RepID=A0ACC3MFH0_9PEZI|nr:hypothetical protein LTR37_018977 [Vermiconidia calcicola]
MPPTTRGSNKRKRAMDNSQSSTLVLNTLVSLPIIISDYDADLAEARRASGASIAPGESSPAMSPATSGTTSSPSSPSQADTGFTSFTDELWSRMTTNMKHKLREACVEMLKRTDESGQEEKMSRRYDDDARFLD